ncbi:MAG: glycosyltransferase [Lewinellaceae bacterium]|nr:glycosyltransferase [Lewinellaceae bacterium]
MRLSIVIVNYNVRHFLEQALGSVRRALQGIDGEVWVVDNNSADDSVRMVRERFSEVKLIVNTDNPGFAVANNQAIRQSTGDYVLLLNPDTLVEEDTFRKCLTFMDEHPEAGALGCKLLDGSGKFLPESKRGFPTPWVAFCKTFGLSTLFPRSPIFNRYHLGHLPENETNEVDVLAGCFMFLRRTALDKCGLLDEAFFMYGEDIDLSYRIQQAGFKNYYFPDTKIIHYKGESTKKGSLNYVRTFYQAMIIFARKHFSGRRAGLFVMMLQGAIWFRAGLTLFRNFLGKTWLPALDALAIYLGLVLLKNFWANYYYHDPDWFKPNVLWFNFPLYILIWLGTVWLSGGYDAKYNLSRLLRGLGLGTLILSAVYGLLDLDYRPSRALVLMGAVWAVFSTVGIRLAAHFWEFGNFRLGRSKVKNLVVVGSESECARVLGLLNRVGAEGKNFIGRVGPSPTPSPSEQGNRARLGEMAQLAELVRIYEANEIIFCSKDIGSQEIMANMAQIGPSVSYKIVPEESLSIIGSSSKDEPGELYTIDIRYNIAQPSHRRDKRLIDLCICMGLLVTFPVWLIFSGKRRLLLNNWGTVLLGQKTWVGYAPNAQNSTLPTLRSGVFSPLDALKDLNVNEETAARLNFFFAKDWEMERDLAVFFKA